MIERALLLRPVRFIYPFTRRLKLVQAIDQFLDSDEFGELNKHKLGDLEWQALEAFKNILDVSSDFMLPTLLTPNVVGTTCFSTEAVRGKNSNP